MVRRFSGRKYESKVLRELNTYLGGVEVVKSKLIYFPVQLQPGIFYLSVLSRWNQLGEKLLLALLDGRQLPNVQKEILEQYNKAIERRARIAYSRALYEVCWLASFLVFRMEQSKALEKAISLIRSRQYDEAYKLATEVHNSMKLAYLETLIEKIGYYIVFIVIGIVGSAMGQFGSNIGFGVGVLVLVLMFLYLPYRTFTKLYYE